MDGLGFPLPVACWAFFHFPLSKGLLHAGNHREGSWPLWSNHKRQVLLRLPNPKCHTRSKHEPAIATKITYTPDSWVCGPLHPSTPEMSMKMYIAPVETCNGTLQLLPKSWLNGMLYPTLMPLGAKDSNEVPNEEKNNPLGHGLTIYALMPSSMLQLTSFLGRKQHAENERDWGQNPP